MTGPVHISAVLPEALAPAREAVADGDPRRCMHENWKPRRRTIAGGQVRVFLQCLDCGHARALKMADYPNLSALEAFDEDLQRRLWDQRAQSYQEQHERELEERSAEWWSRYNEYLTSTEWLERRRRVLNRSRGTCEACLERRATEVHHTTYKHVGHEPLFELRAVCQRCHEELTEMDRGEWKPLENYRR